jgi:hypothetical protein
MWWYFGIILQIVCGRLKINRKARKEREEFLKISFANLAVLAVQKGVTQNDNRNHPITTLILEEKTFPRSDDLNRTGHRHYDLLIWPAHVQHPGHRRRERVLHRRSQIHAAIVE